MKQAEKKSKAKSKNTVPLSKSEYETVKRQVSEKNKRKQAVKLPQTAQQSIPFDYMTKDGIAIASEPERFSLLNYLFGKKKPTETRYSKTVQFYDAEEHFRQILQSSELL